MSSEARIFCPESIHDLDDIIKRTKGNITFVAGATDLLVRKEQWREQKILLDLTGVKKLSHEVQCDKNGIVIGAALPLSALLADKMIAGEFPMLHEACRQIGSVQIQNRATIGGNIANASPAGDTLPVLAVYDARLQTGPQQNGRFVLKRLNEVMLGPGQTGLPNNAYIAQIYLPRIDPQGMFWYFRKVGPRHAMAISKVSLAVLGWLDDKRIADIRICTGSVTPQIARAAGTESLLRGKRLTPDLIRAACTQIIQEINPITDIRSTRPYRQKTTAALLAEALGRIASEPA